MGIVKFSYFCHINRLAFYGKISEKLNNSTHKQIMIIVTFKTHTFYFINWTYCMQKHFFIIRTTFNKINVLQSYFSWSQYNQFHDFAIALILL